MAHKRNRHSYVQHYDLLDSTTLHLQFHFLRFSSTVLTTSVTYPSITMSPRSACGWPEREEKNLPSWLDAHRDLSWKALSDAYYEEYQVDRSVESLRGKKYHILRKQRRTGAKAPGRSGKQKRPGDMRRSLVDSGSRSPLPDNNSAQRNIDKWFQTILAADPSQSGDSDKPAQTSRSKIRMKYFYSSYIRG
jgi:hypothetical protein